MESISGSNHLGAIFKRYPAEFEASQTWSEFCTAIHSENLINYSWAQAGFETTKLNPAMQSGRSLAFPTARKFSDLFSEARFFPAYGENNRTKYHEAGFQLMSDGNHKPLSQSAAPCGHVLAKERYVSLFADGTVVRGSSGAQFYMTQVKPVAFLEERIRRDFPTSMEVFGAFEAITWHSGHVLIISRGAKMIGSDYVALLEPGASCRDIMPKGDLDLIAAEEAAEADAWGCIYVGTDGRHYLDEASCKVRIERRR